MVYEGACGRIFVTRVEAHHFDGRNDHVATVSLAHEVMLLVVECVGLVLAMVVLAAAGVTPPLESARGLCRRTKASTRAPS